MFIKNLFIAIFTATVVFFCSNSHLTDNEIQSIGNGAAIYNNFISDNQFAVLKPPLSGILSFLSLKCFFDFNLYPIPIEAAGNYYDFVSYSYALKSSKIIGKNILKKLSHYDMETVKRVIRFHNFLAMLILFVICNTGVFTILLGAIFSYMNICSSTIELIAAVLFFLSFYLMKSIVIQRTTLKFILLGIVIGLSAGNYGLNGFIFTGISLCAPIISHDLQKKTRSKGFQSIWMRDCFLSFIIAIIISWMIYGMNLACLCQLESLLGWKDVFPKAILNWKIVPFFDTMKQSVFEVIFRDKVENYTFFERISRFFNIYNVIITLSGMILAFYKKCANSIAICIISLVVVFFYGKNIEEVNIFLKTIAIIQIINFIFILINIKNIEKNV